MKHGLVSTVVNPRASRTAVGTIGRMGVSPEALEERLFGLREQQAHGNPAHAVSLSSILLLEDVVELLTLGLEVALVVAVGFNLYCYPLRYL